jgi:hypothetical protein
METRDLDLISRYCTEARRLADARGDKLLSYFLGMALVDAREARKREGTAVRRPARSFGSKPSARSSASQAT